MGWFKNLKNKLFDKKDRTDLYEGEWEEEEVEHQIDYDNKEQKIGRASCRERVCMFV